MDGWLDTVGGVEVGGGVTFILFLFDVPKIRNL